MDTPADPVPAGVVSGREESVEVVVKAAAVHALTQELKAYFDKVRVACLCGWQSWTRACAGFF
jgi:hypothetical protein